MTFTRVSSYESADVFPYTINKYISTKSKMQLVHINKFVSPGVKGYFVFATEMHDNSGLPTVLQQMIFGGSEKFPYANFMTKNSDTCLSSTTAWARKDHTAFQLHSVSWSAFKKFAPVCVDHLFHPTLTEEYFTNIVHYVDPKSFKDKGRAYLNAEYALEDSPWSTDIPDLNNTIFDDKSGYRFSELGLPSCIRELKVDDIKKYHKEMYTPDNMCLIILGDIAESDLLEYMDMIDKSLDSSTQKRLRPFMDTESAQTLVPRFDLEIVEKAIQVPREDEEDPSLKLSWITALASDPLLNVSLRVLFQYLTIGSESILSQQFVNVDKPKFSHCLHRTDSYYRTIMNICFHEIPIDDLEDTKSCILNFLLTHKIEIGKMKEAVKFAKRRFKDSEYENTADILISCMSEFLYNKDSDDKQSLKNFFDDIHFFDVLESYTEVEWQNLYDKWICQNKPAIFVSQPNVDLFEEQEEENEERSAKNAAIYGEKGSKQLQELLDKANINIKREMPEEDIASKIWLDNPAESIRFNRNKAVSSIGSAETDLAKKVIVHKPDDLPVFMYTVDVSCRFVEINVQLDPRCIKDPNLLPFYHVFCGSLLMPMRMPDGSVISQQEVKSLKRKDTLYAEISHGQKTYGDNLSSDTINLVFMADADKYELCVGWIKHIFCDMVFEESAVTEVLEEFIEDCSHSLLPFDVFKSMINKECFEKNSLINALGNTFSVGVLKAALEDIKKGDFEKSVLPKLEQFRKLLLDNIKDSHVLVFGHLTAIGVKNLYSPWVNAFGPGLVVTVPDLPTISSGLTGLGRNRSQNKAFVYVNSETDKSDKDVTSSIVASTSLNIGYDHEDYPAVLVAQKVLQFKKTAFTNLYDNEKNSFTQSIYTSVESNEIKCQILSAADAITSYNNLKKVVEDYVNGENKVSKSMLYNVVCAKIRVTNCNYEFENNCEKNEYETVFNKKLPIDFDEKLLSKMSMVDEPQVIRAIEKYFVPLFDPNCSTVFINCETSSKDRFVEYLESENYKTVVEEMPVFKVQD